jgi:hypothetical protein
MLAGGGMESAQAGGQTAGLGSIHPRTLKLAQCDKGSRRIFNDPVFSAV